MRSIAKNHVRHAVAMSAIGLFMAYAPHASAANAQTTCSASTPDTAGTCTLSVGNVVFTTSQGDSAAWPVYEGTYGSGSLNLPKADVAQTANGGSISFDPAYSKTIGYSGTSEGTSGNLRITNLSESAAPGFALDTITMRVQGVVTIHGAARVTVYGQSENQSPSQIFNTEGDHVLDWTFTTSAASLASGNSPAMAWDGYATNGIPLNGDPAVTGLLSVVLNKVSVSASVAAVPEGSTLALTALGLLGIAAVRAKAARARG
jgi:hypothetical protein